MKMTKQETLYHEDLGATLKHKCGKMDSSIVPFVFFLFGLSLFLSFSYTSGNFSLLNLACIFQRWASSNALGLCEQASWMHTHLVSFVELSYIYSSSASIAWQSLLLASTSIDGHLHSPLISRVDVRLSPFLSSPHNPHHYILFHP